MNNKTESGRSFTVLVVDDVAYQREIMIEHLRPLYQIRTAASGLEALAQAKSLCHALLLVLDQSFR